MDFIRSHKLIAATIAIQIIALPLILFLVKQNQDTRTQAVKSTTLSFSPASSTSSPITKLLGESFSLDVMITPGSNLVSLAKIEVTYNPARVVLDPTTPLVVNSQVFPQIVEGPVYSSGKVQITLSVGPDQTKVIQTESKAFTLNFKGIFTSSQNTDTSIGFGPTSALFSIAPQDTSTENVLSTTVPAAIRINPGNTASPTPVPPTVTPTKTPTPTPIPPTVTPSPTKTPTPTPAPTAGPTPTTQPNATTLNFTGIKLHGLGKGGDNPNPTSNGTLNPLRPTRTLTVEIYNTSGVLINTIPGGMAYDGPQIGTFDALVTVPSSVVSGNYLIKVKTPFYLRRQIPGFLSLVSGTTNQMPLVTLIAGDVNSDNALTVADYDIIMDCYSDILPAKNCNATKKLTADISDDGKVDQDDYNLFLRELSVQQGE